MQRTLIIFSGTVRYADHVGGWGLTALEDQQVAGLLMWVPAGIVYLLAVVLMLNTWLERIEQQQKGKPWHESTRCKAIRGVAHAADYRDWVCGVVLGLYQ